MTFGCGAAVALDGRATQVGRRPVAPPPLQASISASSNRSTRALAVDLDRSQALRPGRSPDRLGHGRPSVAQAPPNRPISAGISRRPAVTYLAR
jgi:hypothetical protein